MTIRLAVKPPSKGTLVLKLTFKDETGAPATLTSLTWTLTDSAGKVINHRRAVAISPSAAVIALTGADLNFLDGQSRIVTVEALYDSSAGGGLSLRDQIVFPIQPFTEVQ